jgi:hypothetical protein
MMTKLELAPFTANEMSYIKEYCKVSEPVAIALDYLQGEQHAYFGTLLPTIFVTKKKLDAMINASGVHQLKHCKGYAKALREGLNKRFNHLESDEQCLLASAFHPKFRQLGWLRQEKRLGLKKKMQDLVAAKLKKRVEEADLTFPVDNDSADAGTSAETEVTGVDQNPTADIFADMDDIIDEPTHRGRRNLIDVNAETIVTTWTATKRSDKLEDDDFQLNRSLMELFIQFNTPVPSSAGVERLFSQAGDILRPKRISLREDRFHQLMFMRGNRHHWETYKED